MKKLPYIRQSKKFYGKFEVVAAPDLIIPCYNLATARSIVTQLNLGTKNETRMGQDMDGFCKDNITKISRS